MPQLGKNRRGDLILRVLVEIPRNLSDEQRTHLEAFRNAQ
jgi:DnaJ-class molecular chaperone